MSSDTLRPFMNKLLADLVEAAKKDGIITEDEADILKQIELDVKKYENQIAKNLQDKTAVNMTQLLQSLLESAKKVALQDGTITAEEQTLLDIIQEYVKKEQEKSDLPF